jgi:hypothetical protein
MAHTLVISAEATEHKAPKGSNRALINRPWIRELAGRMFPAFTCTSGAQPRQGHKQCSRTCLRWTGDWAYTDDDAVACQIADGKSLPNCHALRKDLFADDPVLTQLQAKYFIVRLGHDQTTHVV